MSNRVLMAFGVITAAAVSLFVGARRRKGASSGAYEEDEPAAPQHPTITIDDDEAAEIISRARPALDRAAKLL